MSIPENFQFSQSSLQNYVDCPRRFQLKYVQQLAWPASEAEPALENERYLQLGAAFHKLAQQYLLGVPPEKLTPLAEQDDQLARWWENFTQEVGKLVNRGSGHYYPEISLSTPIRNFRLVGKYDLLSITENQYMIIDWKTSRQQPKREWVSVNLQTRVYPFLLANAGAHLNNGQSLDPDQIEMIYWYANFPTAPLRFIYNEAQFLEDQTYLTNLIDEIQTLSDEPAPKTENHKRCRFCVYRSLCNRGVEAGPFDELEEDDTLDDFDFELDFEQIAEIEF
jgi:hypothetical protein